ncbi:SDR family oxidoreductase [Actinospica durhamensis]|uniref:SDR family oxidoreductase n=1 Tax=Actinospica durhamensis TaxID=1508375 RepID=A0A941ITX8_9ACTN|nr:SDR family oxidoreductase [Actinospica durhamensis]MBR7834836.1 SDR family oxidoreductase [Actinospica durhamensis]
MNETTGAGTGQKVAIITGATGGIGSAIVGAYRELGYAVVATSREMPGSEDPQVLAVNADLVEPDAGERIVGAAMDRFGRVDSVVNSAGVYIGKAFTDYTDRDFDLIVGVNLRGFFNVSRSAVGAMLSRDGGGGHLVNISTSLVDHPNARVPCALASLTKGGLNAVTRELAIEYAARGIRVNCVSLGVVRTPMNPEATPELAARHPLGRMEEVDDVVQAIRYLEQASFVTGEILHVDGGQSAGG